MTDNHDKKGLINYLSSFNVVKKPSEISSETVDNKPKKITPGPTTINNNNQHPAFDKKKPFYNNYYAYSDLYK